MSFESRFWGSECLVLGFRGMGLVAEHATRGRQ